jgi:hypothetical protein
VSAWQCGRRCYCVTIDDDAGRAWEHGTAYKRVGRTVTMDGQPFSHLGLVVVAGMAFAYRGVVWEQPLLVRCGGKLCYGAVAGVEFRFSCMCNWTIVRNPYLVEVTCMSASCE